MTRLFLLSAALKLEPPERRVRAASDVDINASGASENPDSSEQLQLRHFFLFFFFLLQLRYTEAQVMTAKEEEKNLSRS